MSEAPATTEQPATPAAAVATPPATPPAKAPTFEGEFDPERASRLVANLRADVEKRDRELADLRKVVAESGDASKSSADEIAALKARLDESDRALLVAKAAKAHALPEALVPFLTGKTAEELDAQGKALAEHMKAPVDEIPGRPRPRLQSLSDADGEPDFDPEKIAAAVRKR